MSESLYFDDRFQWWRDLISAAYEKSIVTIAARDHPVGLALHTTIRTVTLNRRWIDRILESRQSDISAGQPKTLGDLETYAEHSSSSCLYLTLELLGVANEHADIAASHIGVSSGIVTSLRSLPYLASQVSVSKVESKYVHSYAKNTLRTKFIFPAKSCKRTIY
jgi:NADH dehydrogenase [ubiquinone] 1 alpha subcomplex assembly factor 6